MLSMNKKSCNKLQKCVELFCDLVYNTFGVLTL